MKEKLPKNMCLIGEPGHDKKILIEEYVLSYLQKTVKQRKEPQMIVFFGDGYEREGTKYYFLKGIASHRASDNTLKKIDEFYFQTIGRQYFPELKGIGWYYMENRYDDILHILRGMQEQDFSEIGGYYIYFEQNGGMEEYMIRRQQRKKDGNDVVKREPVKKASDRKAAIGKRPKIMISDRKPAPMMAVQILNMVSLCILIICCIIAVTTLNQYDKMKQLEETVTYLETSMEEQKNLPEE